MNFSQIDIFFSVAVLILFLASVLVTHAITAIRKTFPEKEIEDDLNDEVKEMQTIRRGISITFITVIVFFALYHISVSRGVGSHIMEWLNLVIRWAHVVLGIAWIGASFYFIFLENSLNRTENLRNELAGNLWAVHGGGFYYVEKYKTSPAVLPKHLHWFKYEAYFTWLTGMVLLTLVYFMNAKAVMVDASVSNISPAAAILISIGTMFLGWEIYAFMCRTSLLHRKKLFAIIGFAITIFISWFLSQLLSGRAAFMMVGALLGTIMAGNVFFCIIPAQKALVAAARLALSQPNGARPVDPELGKVAGLRSLHNNYITLPVIFIMISNHFPTTFGTGYNWAILAGLTLASVAVRHYINLYEKGIYSRWIIPFVSIVLIALVIVTAPARRKPASELPPVSITQVQPIIQQRCVSCHSSSPVDDVNKIAPNGVVFDTPDDIKKHAERILVRTVQTKTMPQANKTAMTEEEREVVRVWIEQGAKL